MSPIPIRLSSFVCELTRRCNYDCLHCYNVWKNPIDYPGGEPDTDLTLRILTRMLDETGARRVTLTGGEPLLRRDIHAIIGHLRQRDVAINLISNGSLLSDPMCDRLVPAIDLFELPLLSADRAIHDRLSGAAGAFDKVTRAIARLELRGARVVAVFVATRLNLPGFRKVVELAVSLGVDALMINRFNPGGRGRDHIDLLQASPAALQQALDDAEQLSARYRLPMSCAIAMPPCLIDTDRYPHLSFGFCAAGTERAYYTVDPCGNVRPCNHTPTILGNILTDRFADLAHSPCMQTFMAARPEACSGCAVEAQCLGGCKAAAEVCCGSIRAMDPFLAAYHHQAPQGISRATAAP